MIINDNTRSKGVSEIRSSDLDRVNAFLQGTVYGYLASAKPNVWFKACTLVDGFNREILRLTPLQALVVAYNENYDEVNKACGRLLHNVLQDDIRRFEIDRSTVASYRWVDHPENSEATQ